ncbi:hypothetical protein Tco_1526045 [Tanacetum coccineum]
MDTMTMSLMHQWHDTICGGVIGPRRSLLERIEASTVLVPSVSSAAFSFPAAGFFWKIWQLVITSPQVVHETDIREKDEKSSQNDKTGHGVEKRGKGKVKSKPNLKSCDLFSISKFKTVNNNNPTVVVGPFNLVKEEPFENPPVVNMAANGAGGAGPPPAGGGGLPVPDLQTMEELCQPSLDGRGGPIAPIAIQATTFGLKNDMIQQV